MPTEILKQQSFAMPRSNPYVQLPNDSKPVLKYSQIRANVYSAATFVLSISLERTVVQLLPTNIVADVRQGRRSPILQVL